MRKLFFVVEYLAQEQVMIFITRVLVDLKALQPALLSTAGKSILKVPTHFTTKISKHYCVWLKVLSRLCFCSNFTKASLEARHCRGESRFKKQNHKGTFCTVMFLHGHFPLSFPLTGSYSILPYFTHVPAIPSNTAVPGIRHGRARATLLCSQVLP